MKYFNRLKKISSKRNIVTLGTFDGVHLGHQQIISRAVDLANNMNGTSIVFTFSNHPISITNPSHCPQKISSQSEKIKLIKELHIDVLMNIPFTQQLSTILPEKFIKLLCDNINPKIIVVGPNFSFGYKGWGSPKTLVAFEKLYGFKTEISEVVLINKTMVSSTLIRKLIAEGEYVQVERLLGRAFHPEIKSAIY